MLLDGKVAIVSGIGPGMGRAISLLFAEHGADLVLGARTVASCEAVAEEVRALGCKAEVVHLDITDPESCRAAVAAGVGAFGGIDILVNNAFQDGNHKTFERSTHRIEASYGAYATSKGALETATKALATELGVHGIRVNSVFPGYIWGDKVEWYFEHLAGKERITPEEYYRRIADETALKYLPHSSEIAGTVLFFASDLSSPVTGQGLGVNAGHWIP